MPKLALAPRDRWVSALVLLSTAAMACFYSSDGDLGFHLATGREILASGRIPATNVLSFAEPNHPWLLHQWLPAVLFELLFRTYGIAGVTLLKMGVVGVTWTLVYAAARLSGASAFCAGFACVWAAVASSFRFESRPYLFTHATLAVTVLSIAQYFAAAGEPESRALRRSALAVAIVSAVLASNLHAGAIDSFIAMAVVSMGMLAEPLRARVFETTVAAPSGRAHATAWLCALVAAGALAALSIAAYHPIGPSILMFPFEMGRDTYLARHLVEFRAPFEFSFWLLCAYWTWLAACLASAVRRWRTEHLAWIGLALLYALLSLRFARMAYAFAIVSVPLVAAVLSGIRTLRVRPSVATFGLVVAGIAGPFYVYRDHHPGFGFEPHAWPLGHFRFVREHQLRGDAFVSDAWAGPWLGVFYPSRKVFFDDRMEAYSPEFYRDVYQRIRYADAGWDTLLDRYRIEVVLLRYTSPVERALQGGRANLRQRLARDPRFALVHFDDEGELFVRAAGLNDEIAAHSGMHCVDPDRRAFVSAPAGCADQLERAVAAGERSATLFGLSAVAAATMGNVDKAQRYIDAAARLDPGDAWIDEVRARIRAAAQSR